MGHQSAIVHQRVSIHTLGLAIIVKDYAFVSVVLVVLASVVRSVVHERILFSVLVVLWAVRRELELHTLAVVVVERVRVALCASRLGWAQQAQVHSVLCGEVDLVAVIGVLAALDRGRGVGAVPLQHQSEWGRIQVSRGEPATHVNRSVGRLSTLLKIGKVLCWEGRGEAQEEE